MKNNKTTYLAMVILLAFGLALTEGSGLAGANYRSSEIAGQSVRVAGSSASPSLFWYERTFGEAEVPYLADTDHLYLPTGVVMNSNDNLWVVESNGVRAMKYTSAGAYLMSIGIAGVTNRADQTHLSWPYDVAEDASGNVWVADQEAHRAVLFDAQGKYLTQLGMTWEAGSDNAHFSFPSGIALDSTGNVYIADTSNHRIQVFDSSRVYSTTIGVTGIPGSDNSHFNGPVKMTFDVDGNLYVVDSNNHRVQILDSSYNYVATLGVSGMPGSDNAHFNFPRGVAVDAVHIYVVDRDNHRVQIFDRTTFTYQDTLGTGFGNGNYEFDTPIDVTLDSAGNLYVSDANNHRVQKYNSSLAYVRTFGVTGEPYITDGLHYYQPVDVAVDAEGNIAIIEGWGRGERLIKLDASGSPLFTIGEAGVPGSDNDHFADPFGVAFDASGNIYVAECGNHRVQIFSSQGVWGARLGTGFGTGSDQFNCPSGVAFDTSGNIYVADANNHRIQIFDNNRIYKATLGEAGVSGSDKSHFNWPNDVEVDAFGNIFVADTFNHRVQIFDSELNWQKSLGVTGLCGNDNTHFCEPWGVAIDPDGNLYVAEKFNPRVQVFDSHWTYVTTIGGEYGDQAGQFRELYGVDVDAEGNVYAADLFNFRVEKFIPVMQVYLPLTVRHSSTGEIMR